MRLMICATGLLVMASCAGQQNADEPASMPDTRAASAVARVALPFDGVVAVRAPGQPVSLVQTGTDATEGMPWQWASVTKQFIAVLVMQDVEAGRLSLDDTIADHLPDFAGEGRGAVTIEQLLRSTSGLGEPVGLPTDPGVDPLDFCAVAPVGAPGARFRYTNCDFIVAAAILEAVNAQPWDALLRTRILDPLEMSGTGVLTAPVTDASVMTSGQPHLYGAAGAMFGPPEDLLTFNAALMDGRLLNEASLAKLWDGDPSKGYVALGQWAFSAPLRGCDGAVRLIERRGHIGTIQVRNLIAPDLGRSFVALTSDPEAEFGEIWMGRGASHDLASAAFCGG